MILSATVNAAAMSDSPSQAEQAGVLGQMVATRGQGCSV